jgi:hypothetical protein
MKLNRKQCLALWNAMMNSHIDATAHLIPAPSGEIHVIIKSDLLGGTEHVYALLKPGGLREVVPDPELPPRVPETIGNDLV